MTENSERFKRFNTWYSRDRETYRKFAESKRRQTRFTQESLTAIYYAGRDYIIEQQEKGEPLTISGLQIACGCNRTDFRRMKSGEYDWRRFQFQEYAGIDESELQTIHDDHLGFDVTFWFDQDGERFVMNLFSEVMEWFYLTIQEQLEAVCYTNNKPLGAIFLLKTCFGWSDKPKEYRADKSPVSVATKEEAEEALKRLNSK